MRLLTSTDLSLRVLMRLSATPDAHVNTDVLARELAVSRHHLHKIVQYLVEVRLVRTIRGARGGVMLAQPASEIRVGEFVRGHEQDQALVVFPPGRRSLHAAATLSPARHVGVRKRRLLPVSRSIHPGGLSCRTQPISARASETEAVSRRGSQGVAGMISALRRRSR